MLDTLRDIAAKWALKTLFGVENPTPALMDEAKQVIDSIATAGVEALDLYRKARAHEKAADATETVAVKVTRGSGGGGGQPKDD